MHYCLNADARSVLPVHDAEREPPTQEPAERGRQGASQRGVLACRSQNALDLVEGMAAESRRSFLTEGDRLSMLGQRYRMEANYHPNLVRIGVGASSREIGSTASSSRLRT